MGFFLGVFDDGGKEILSCEWKCFGTGGGLRRLVYRLPYFLSRFVCVFMLVVNLFSSQSGIFAFKVRSFVKDCHPFNMLLNTPRPPTQLLQPPQYPLCPSRSWLWNMYTLTNHRTPPPHKHPHNRMYLQHAPLSPHPAHNPPLAALYHSIP